VQQGFWIACDPPAKQYPLASGYAPCKGGAKQQCARQRGARRYFLFRKSPKYWVTDPSSLTWETFHSLGSIPVFGSAEENAIEKKGEDKVVSSGCCIPIKPAKQANAACCVPDKEQPAVTVAHEIKN